VKRFRCIVLICGLCAVSVPSPGACDNKGGMDIVLAIDTSGSMKKTDPRNLRAEAARLFLHLLGRDDCLALVTFDTTTRVLAPLKGVEEDRTSLVDRLRHVSSDGKYTNIHEAISRSYDILKSSTRKARAVIVMTDGKMDLGHPAKDREQAQQMRDHLLPTLSKEGIRVFSIAFTRFSDIQLLKRVALSTEGFFYLAEKDEDLHVTFADIYGQLTMPQSIPIEKGEFYVDRSVEELDIVITKAAPHTGVALEMPDRRSLTFQKHPENVRWHQSRAFEMITVAGPLVGAWNIQYGADKGNRVFVLTDLKLVTSFREGLVPPDSEATLEVWLNEGETTTKGTSIHIHDVRMSAEVVPKGEPGASVRLLDDGRHGDKEAGDGVYHAVIKPTRRGEHVLRIRAQGPTFGREKQLSFYVPEEDLEDTLQAPDDPTPKEEPAPPDAEVPPEQASTDAGSGTVDPLHILLLVETVIILAAVLIFVLRRSKAEPSPVLPPELPAEPVPDPDRISRNLLLQMLEENIKEIEQNPALGEKGNEPEPQGFLIDQVYDLNLDLLKNLEAGLRREDSNPIDSLEQTLTVQFRVSVNDRLLSFVRSATPNTKDPPP